MPVFPPGSSTLSAFHVKYSGKGAVFFGKKTHDLGGWPDDCLKLRQDRESFIGYRKIIELSGPNIHDVRFFFAEKQEVAVRERGMIEETPAFPGFFLGSLLNRSVLVDDHIVIIPDAIDLNPSITRFHTGVASLIKVFSHFIFIYYC